MSGGTWKNWKKVGNIFEVLSEKFNEKVDKVEGKGLSTNDFTDYYKDWIDNYVPPEFEELPDLSLVASTGDYNDLSNKPTIPDISGKVDKSDFITMTVTFDDDTTKNYKFYAEEVNGA